MRKQLTGNSRHNESKKRAVILSPRSPGITRSHKLLARFFERKGVNVETRFRINQFLRLGEIIYILPVHYFILFTIIRCLGGDVFFFCHGKSSLAHNGLIKHKALTYLTELLEKFSVVNLYVSKITKGEGSGYIIHNLTDAKNYQITIEKKKVYYFGRICKSKGVPIILSLSKCLENYEFHFFGMIQENYSEFLLEVESHQNCIYHGAYTDFKDLSQAIEPNSLFISLNSNEPFGIAYLEALELGLVPIHPSSAGISECLVGAICINQDSDIKSEIIEAFGKKYEIQVEACDERERLITDILSGRISI